MKTEQDKTRHTPTGFKVMPTSITGQSLLVGIEEDQSFSSFSLQMSTEIAERLAYRDSCHTALVEALKLAKSYVVICKANKRYTDSAIADLVKIEEALKAVEGE